MHVFTKSCRVLHWTFWHQHNITQECARHSSSSAWPRPLQAKTAQTVRQHRWANLAKSQSQVLQALREQCHAIKLLWYHWISRVWDWVCCCNVLHSCFLSNWLNTRKESITKHRYSEIQEHLASWTGHGVSVFFSPDLFGHCTCAACYSQAVKPRAPGRSITKLMIIDNSQSKFITGFWMIGYSTE